MCNVLLSLFAMFVGGMPDGVVATANQDANLSQLFRDEGESIATGFPRLRWLSPQGNETPVVRGQSSEGAFTTPPMTAPLALPYQPTDPFQIQAGPDPVMPYLNDPSQTILSGINGPQPYRFG